MYAADPVVVVDPFLFQYTVGILSETLWTSVDISRLAPDPQEVLSRTVCCRNLFILLEAMGDAPWPTYGPPFDGCDLLALGPWPVLHDYRRSRSFQTR